MSGGPLRHESDGGLHVVTFDHPPLNLYDADLAEALHAAVDELERTQPRAVLFRAEGRVVSGGVDVKLFDRIAGTREGEELFTEGIALIRRIAALPCPTVFAAHALTLTWAFELALACDLIVAGENASFGLVEAGVGLTPAMGGTQRLAERAGSGRARELVMTGEVFPASVLERWNVVNRVLPQEGFDEHARAFAARLAAGPTKAHAATKGVLAAYLEGGLDAADAAVPGLAGALWDTEDLRGAIATFLSAGPGNATFSGR
jgi:enoyl-CoA hydratase/carnithine racemase